MDTQSAKLEWEKLTPGQRQRVMKIGAKNSKPVVSYEEKVRYIGNALYNLEKEYRRTMSGGDFYNLVAEIAAKQASGRQETKVTAPMFMSTPTPSLTMTPALYDDQYDDEYDGDDQYDEQYNRDHRRYHY